MPAGKVDRNVLASNYQDPGQAYDDKKTEGAFEVLAQQTDANWDDYKAIKDKLASRTVGDSGAHAVASATINGVTGDNVYDQLYSLKSQINQASTGQIPPGSITADKLVSMGAGSGFNADLFDSMNSDRFVFGGDVSATTLWNSGVDNITKSGFYYITTNSWAGLPLNTNGYVIHSHINGSALYCVQYYIPINSDRVFIRRQSNGTWQAWIELWHTINNVASLAASGYQKLASGLIIQWGTKTAIPSATLAAVTLPISFPSNNATVTLTPVSTGDGYGASVSSTSVTGFSIRHNGPSVLDVRWTAIGY